MAVPEPTAWRGSSGRGGGVINTHRCRSDPTCLPSREWLGPLCFCSAGLTSACYTWEQNRFGGSSWPRQGWTAACGSSGAGGDSAPLPRPLERGWRKQKEGGAAAPQPKVRLRQEVVSTAGQRRGQRIATPVRKLFAREKRPYGLGMVGRLTNRTYRKRIDSYVKRQIEDMDDHRWATRGGV